MNVVVGICLALNCHVGNKSDSRAVGSICHSLVKSCNVVINSVLDVVEILAGDAEYQILALIAVLDKAGRKLNACDSIISTALGILTVVECQLLVDLYSLGAVLEDSDSVTISSLVYRLLKTVINGLSVLCNGISKGHECGIVCGIVPLGNICTRCKNCIKVCSVVGLEELTYVEVVKGKLTLFRTA